MTRNTVGHPKAPLWLQGATFVCIEHPDGSHLAAGWRHMDLTTSNSAPSQVVLLLAITASQRIDA